jgi:plastocyanin
VRTVADHHRLPQPDGTQLDLDAESEFKIMEYMAAGKPIVAFDLAEARVSAGEAVAYANSNDERCFAAALIARRRSVIRL